MADVGEMVAEDESVPCCLVASCGFGDVDELVQDVMKQDVKPEFKTVIEDIVGCKWNFETKYYTCTIRLCKAERPTLGNQQFANNLEAVILLFTPSQSDSWTSVNSWLSYLEHLDPSVKLLVCDSCTDKSQVPKVKIQQWCIEHEFELIELDPVVPDDEEEDEFEVEGIKRITQVIHAHTWPNLVMKDRPDTVSPYMKQLMGESKQEQKNKASQESASLNIHKELGMDAEELSNAIHNEGDDGVESFEKLFSKFQIMKAKADSLPAEERKAYAERIALSFYAAIGGSDNELDLLEDSD